MKTLLFSCALLIGAVTAAQTTWYQIATGTHKKLNTIDFSSANVGYIGGNDSLLLKTTDGGQTWSKLAVSGVTFNLGGKNIVNLDFPTDSIGYMLVGPYGSPYKTVDGGLTWTELQPAGIICFLGGLYFFDAQNGFIGGSGCFQGEVIDKIIAGSFTTTTISYPTWNSVHRVVDIDFLDNSIGFAASHGGNILRTTNGGINWDSISTGMPDTIPLTGVAVINHTLAYATYNSPGNGAGILITTDGGLTWTDDGNAATFFYPGFHCIHEAGNGTIYAGATPSFLKGGLIFEGNAGLWMTAAVDHPINDMASHSNTVVFGVGDSGYVVVNKPPSTVGENRAIGRSGLNIYPNPAEDVLHIELPDELDTGPATVSIYSVEGRLILKATHMAGKTIDVSALSPGLYFVDRNGAHFSKQVKVIKK